MTFKVAYFAPTIIAADQVPPIEFSKLYNLTNQLHQHPELHEADNPFVNVRGGQHIQIYPAKIELEVDWLITWLTSVCQEYMDLVTTQTGVTDLKYCKPIVTNIWTIKQSSGDYQTMHSHLGSNISGNIYISAPMLDSDSSPSNGQFELRLPQLKDISRFIMHDSWKTDASPGTFVVFPSCLPHITYPWSGTGDRVVVSFEAAMVPIIDEDQ